MLVGTGGSEIYEVKIMRRKDANARSHAQDSAEAVEFKHLLGKKEHTGQELRAEIVDDGSDVKPIVEGHHSYEVWGLCVRPTLNFIYATVGDDGSLRIWNAKTKKCIRRRRICTDERKETIMCRAVAWSPDGLTLCVGIGGRVGRKHVGKRASTMASSLYTMGKSN